MRYGVFPAAMWAVFRGSFQRRLPLLTEEAPGAVMKRARREYREILRPIPEFDRDDRFLVNLLSAAMLAAVYRSLESRPDLDAVTAYYRAAMTENAVMRRVLKAEDDYTPRAQAKLARQAEASGRRTNPYTWRFRYEAGADCRSFSAYYSTCGIRQLFRTLGIPEITPAMCAYDYEMARLSGTEFSRRGTLAGGSDCCDCHYRKAAGR